MNERGRARLIAEPVDRQPRAPLHPLAVQYKEAITVNHIAVALVEKDEMYFTYRAYDANFQLFLDALAQLEEDQYDDMESARAMIQHTLAGATEYTQQQLNDVQVQIGKLRATLVDIARFENMLLADME
jgi:ABC-type Zn uptake system ZnuABC Zn-binding protein ZnuA